MHPAAPASLFRQYRVNRYLWAAILALIVIDAGLVYWLDWAVRVPALMNFVLILGACAVVSLIHAYVKPDPVLFLFGNVIGQMICAGFALGFFSYLSATTALPLTDKGLIAADALLGFEWRSYVVWVDSHARLSSLFTFAYRSFGFQIVAFLCLLFAYKHAAHAQRVAIVFFVSAFTCIVLSAVWPAVGGYVYYDIDPNHFVNLHPAAGRVHEQVLLALRDHSLKAVSFPMQGIITFPSFHSALAIMLIYASWPFTRLRLAMIPLNIAMIFATPTDGGHYLVDVLAGIFIAGAAIAFARRLLPA